MKRTLVFVLCWYAVVVAALVAALALNAPAWLAGALTFVGLLGLCAFVLMRKADR